MSLCSISGEKSEAQREGELLGEGQGWDDKAHAPATKACALNPSTSSIFNGCKGYCYEKCHHAPQAGLGSRLHCPQWVFRESSIIPCCCFPTSCVCSPYSALSGGGMLPCPLLPACPRAMPGLLSRTPGSGLGSPPPPQGPGQPGPVPFLPDRWLCLLLHRTHQLLDRNCPHLPTSHCTPWPGNEGPLCPPLTAAGSAWPAPMPTGSQEVCPSVQISPPQSLSPSPLSWPCHSCSWTVYSKATKCLLVNLMSF